MNVCTKNARRLMALLLSACAFWAAAAGADSAQDISSLAGSWTLVAADVQHPDGSRAPDFGAQPKGLLLVDRQGHYSLQIYKSERPAFHSGDKAKGTPEEYEAAVMGSSTHFGTLSIEQGHGVLVFHIQGASFPNWEGQDQRRQYQLNDNTLSYRVAPRPNGDVPISVWKRID